MASTTTIPLTPSAIITQRLNAIKALTVAMGNRYNPSGGGFFLHPALQLRAAPDDSGIITCVNQPVPEGAVIMAIPSVERINYLNLVMNGDENLEPKPLTSSSSSRGTSLTSLKEIIRLVEEMDEQVTQAIVQVGDVVLIVIVMFLISSKQTDTAQQPFASKGCFHWVPDTWPHPGQSGEWTEEEDDVSSQELQGTYAGCLFTVKRQIVYDIFYTVLLPIFEQFEVLPYFAVATFFPSDMTDETEKIRTAAWNTFRYAFSIVLTRSHDGGSTSIDEDHPTKSYADLIPFIDLLDGLPADCQDINVQLERILWSEPLANMENETKETEPSPSIPCYSVSAMRDLKANEQLFISYGNMAPSPFLFKYGVVPYQFVVNPHYSVDVVQLRFPVSLAPTQSDELRIRGLQSHGYPTTPEALEKEFWFMLGPHELKKWIKPLQGGLGADTSSYERNEPLSLRNMRQFIIVAHLTSNEDIRHFIETDRIRGEYQLQDIGRLMLQIIDYNLGRLHNSQLTNETELEELKKNSSGVALGYKKDSAALARILYRDSLAQWRHAICRHYRIFSAADDSQALRDVLNVDRMNVAPAPPCLAGGGCSVCGRTLSLQRCSRCRQVKYCSREHQRSAWRMHRPLCMPVGTQPMDILNREEKMATE